MRPFSAVQRIVGRCLAYLNEFVFRFNRRFYPMTALNSLLGIATRVAASRERPSARSYDGTLPLVALNVNRIDMQKRMFIRGSLFSEAPAGTFLIRKDKKDWLPNVLTLLPARTSQVVTSASDKMRYVN